MAEYFFQQRIPITYFGIAWSECTNNWIYFDTYMDVEKMRALFSLGPEIKVHENLDPKSGTERGFVDPQTGEGIMGKIEGR